MTKEELIKEIEKLEDNKKYEMEHSDDGLTINIMEKVPIKRWRAKLNESYWTISAFGKIYKLIENKDSHDEYYYVSGNYFRTEEEAKRYKKRLLIKQELEDIALELNDNIKIDWFNCKQAKYFLFFNWRFGEISLVTNCFDKHEGATYCLNKNFKDEAIKRIGKKRLIKYLKGC